MSIELGDPEDVVAELRALVAEHPYRERLRLHLMRALHVADRTAEALDCYADVRRGLAEDLGLEPCAELQQLQRRILDDRPAAPRTEAWRRPPQPPAQLPPAPHLIGREDELTELDGLLDPGRATLRVLTGGVGTGKTALALAWAHRAAGHFPDGLLFARLRGCATRAGAGGRGAAPVPHRAGRAALGTSRRGGRQQLNQPLGGDWPAGIQCQNAQQALLTWPGQRQHHPRVLDLQRSEQPDFHKPSFLATDARHQRRQPPCATASALITTCHDMLPGGEHGAGGFFGRVRGTALIADLLRLASAKLHHQACRCGGRYLAGEDQRHDDDREPRRAAPAAGA